MKLQIAFVSIIFLISHNLILQSKEFSYESALRERLFLEEQRNDPRVRAFLDMTGRMECGNCYFSDHKGYRCRYPSTVFTGFEHHPGTVLCAQSGNKELCSSAAGRYMFLESVWKNIARRLYLSDFSPLNQDIAALYLIKERNALDDIKKGDIKAAILKLNTIWASFPGSPHKQPVMRMKDMETFYAMRLDYLKKHLKVKG